MPISTKKEWENLLARARNGSPEAQWEVGSCYEDGLINEAGETIVKPAPVKALHWYTLSAEQGDESSQMALGTLLSSGGEIKPDVDAAIRWTQKAIDKGSSAAAHNLATIYRDLGQLDTAYNWYKRAFEMGDLDSLFEVAICDLFGIGTEKSIDTAQRNLNKIIASEHSLTSQRTKENTHYWLAIINLQLAKSTKRTISIARELLERANEDEDHEQANELLNIIGKTKCRLVQQTG